MSVSLWNRTRTGLRYIGTLQNRMQAQELASRLKLAHPEYVRLTTSPRRKPRVRR